MRPRFCCVPNYLRIAVLAIALTCVIVALSVSPAHAATGTLLKTVNVPVAAQCGSGIGTSVAIVPGALIGMNQIPILLITSCFVSGGGAQTSSLYVMDPATDPATLVQTVNTTTTPQEGWGSLSLRGDK